MKRFMVVLFSLLPFSFLLSQETMISGKALGHDGKPMKKANVELYRMSDPSKPLFSTEVKPDGSFTVATGERGLLRVQFTGVDHMPSNVPVLVEQPSKIGVGVRLATYPYGEKTETAQIIGDFNNFSMGAPKDMIRQADGTFVAEFETDKAQFKYQIFNVFYPPRSINGTQSEDYEYDGGGDYRSVTTPKNGKVRIVFDPRAVVRSDAKEQVTFDSKNKSAVQFQAAYQEVTEAQQGFQKAALEYQKSGKDMKNFQYDVSAPLKSLKDRIEKEKDSYGRQLLFMEYLGIAPLARQGVDSMAVRQALTGIPAESGLWSISPGLILSNVNRAGKGFDVDTYINNFLTKNPDRSLKSTILFSKMMGAKFEQKEEEYKKYYTMLVTEYGDTQQGQMAKQRFSIESAVAVGKQVPSFKLASLDNKDMIISNDLLKGKLTMIDFWAVWCGPCIGEMGSLHKAYERFKGKNFQIISLSFDNQPEDVKKFRTDKWKMPWLHAFVEKGFESDLAKRFEVMGIPKPILVDQDGKILAMEGDLRGENLQKTLEKFLGK